jgi:hypothetical protein
MKMQSLKIAREFCDGLLNAEDFASKFFDAFHIERDTGALVAFKDNEVLTTIFCNLDIFNPAKEREDYEIDQEILLKRIKFLLDALNKNENISEALEQVYSII